MSKKQTLPKERKRVGDGVNPVGMWAVFRKTRTAKAHFVVLHETRITAVGEAQRLAQESIATYGMAEDILFFVVLVDCQIGLGAGKLHEGAESALSVLQTEAYASGRQDENEHWLAETGIDSRPEESMS